MSTTASINRKRPANQLQPVEDPEELDDDVIAIEDDEEDDIDEDDSDAELQLALRSGLLKPGLNVEMEKAEFSYDAEQLASMTEKLKQSNLDWLERLDVTCPPVDESELPSELTLTDSSDLVNDDFKREMLFFRQAQAAVKIAIPKLLEAKVPVHRPPDFFAEMAKSDEHMEKVRKRLQVKSETAEKLEKIRQFRATRKLGKELQREVEKKKLADKKETNKKVENFKKGKTDNLNDVLSDEEHALIDAPVVHKKRKTESSKQEPELPGSLVAKPRKVTRKMRDKKFGRGGKKSGMNRNTKKSFNDIPPEDEPKFGIHLKKKLHGKDFKNRKMIKKRLR